MNWNKICLGYGPSNYDATTNLLESNYGSPLTYKTFPSYIKPENNPPQATQSKVACIAQSHLTENNSKLSI